MPPAAPNGDAGEQARVRLRRAEGRTVNALLKYSLRFGKAFFEHAWSDFFLGQPPDGDFASVHEFETMFVPWFTTAFVRDPHDDVVQPDWPDEPLGLHWLAAERPIIDALDRGWLTAACRSPMSVFVVTHIEPDRSIDLRDVLTGREFHVLELQGTRGLHATNLHVARVVTAGGISLMFGAAPYVFPADYHVDLLEWRDRVFGRRKIRRQDLEDFDIEIRELYFDLVRRLHHPVAPVLKNTDGDDFVPTTLVFDLALPVGDALDRLKPLATVGDDVLIDDVEKDDAGAIVRASLSWAKAGNKKNKAWDNTILGSIRLEPGRLTADVNSIRRAGRLIALVKKYLGKFAALASRDATPLAQALGATDDEAEARSGEFDEIEDRLYCEHLEAWTDMRVPALRNQTPRQASRTARGRERLEALLASFASRDLASRPARKQAMADLRRQLGLPESG